MPFLLIKREITDKDLTESRTEVAGPRLQIGRGTGNDLYLDDPRVSLTHATLEQVGDTYILRDRTSTTGTFVNGAAVREQRLSDDDEIQIGPYTLRVRLPAAAPSPLTLVVEQHQIGRASAAEKQVTYLAKYRLYTGFFTKRRLTAIGVVLLLVGVMAVMLSGKKAALAPGEVAQAHSFFANDCAQCHKSAWHSVTDTPCQTCHDTPVHHVTQVSTPACVSCHREHRGQQVDLSDVQDTLCTQCHADLRTREGSTPLFASGIESFTSGHPEFAVTVRTADQDASSRIRLSDTAHLQDTARIKLNHEKHLILKPEELAGLGFDKPPTCGRCHQLDAPGAYMQPIAYEKHCQECHSRELEFDERFPKQSVPHDEPEKVHTFLVNTFTQYLLENTDKCDTRVIRPIRQRPGQPLTQEEARSLKECVSEEVQRGESLLFNIKGKACQKCHMLSSAPDSTLPAVESPAIPQRWLPHSVFNHQVHARVGYECTDCHKSVHASQQTRDVLLPDIKICQDCHTAAKGASTACVTCHLYHGQHPTAAMPPDRPGGPGADRATLTHPARGQ